MTGVITQLVADRGYGFVRAPDGAHYFFHASGCHAAYNNLRVGDVVEYDEQPSDKGPRACNVRLAA